MKKFILFGFAFASLAGVLVSCSEEILDEPIVEPSGAEDDTEIISKEDLEKSLRSYKPLSLTAEESYISEKSVDFAWKLMSENSKLAGGKNTAISPLSASLALSMTATGAVGSTQQDILATLGYEVDIDKANQSAKKLASALTTRDEITNVILANSFWHQPSLAVKQNYKTDIANFYGSDIYAIDDKTFVADANEWCSKATRGLIKDFIKDGTQADWMILNATYFKGIWRNGYRFDADNTALGVFKNADGTSSRTEMMHRTGDYPYKETDLAQVVAIPFGNSAYSMNFILPASNLSVDECLQALAEGEWRNAMPVYDENNSTNYGYLDIRIPKFKVESRGSLKSEVVNLGMGKAFSEQADFSGISDTKTYIGDIRQGVNLSIDEEGAMAAAVTQIIPLGATGAQAPEPVIFNCNRPFIFCITEKSTGCILFAGKIVKL